MKSFQQQSLRRYILLFAFAVLQHPFVAPRPAAAAAAAATSASGYECSAWSASGSGRFPKPQAQASCSTTGVYTGWIAASNMGDDLIYDIFYEVLRIAIQHKVPHATVTLEYDSHLTGRHIIIPDILPRDLVAAEFLIMGGGSLLEVRDNPYTRICKAAGDVRLPVYYHATGSQYPDTQNVADRAAIMAAISVPLRFGGLRGRLGLERLQNINPEFVLPVIYDSALLSTHLYHIRPSPLSSKLKQEGPPVVCFAGTEHRVNQWFFGDGFDVMDEAVAGFVNLTRTNKVVLLPVDKSSMQRALQVQEAVLGLGVPAEQFLVNHAFTEWSAIMAVMSHCSIVFTDRLHGGILSAAVGTPFSFFVDDWNRFKQEDFSSSLGLSNFQERVSETFGKSLRVQRLIDTMHDVNSNRTALVREMRRHVSMAYTLHMKAVDKFVSYLFACKTGLQESLDNALVVRISGQRSTVFEGGIVTIDACETRVF